MNSFVDTSFTKASLTGRQATHAQFCPLFKKKPRSTLRAPLTKIWNLKKIGSGVTKNSTTLHCIKEPTKVTKIKFLERNSKITETLYVFALVSLASEPKNFRFHALMTDSLSFKTYFHRNRSYTSPRQY